MAIPQLSLIDAVTQAVSSTTATATTATAGNWQQFQDLLKTAIDQNNATDTSKPPDPPPAPPTSASDAASANSAQDQAKQANAASTETTDAARLHRPRTVHKVTDTTLNAEDATDASAGADLKTGSVTAVTESSKETGVQTDSAPKDKTDTAAASAGAAVIAAATAPLPPPPPSPPKTGTSAGDTAAGVSIVDGVATVASSLAGGTAGSLASAAVAKTTTVAAAAASAGIGDSAESSITGTDTTPHGVDATVLPSTSSYFGQAAANGGGTGSSDPDTTGQQQANNQPDNSFGSSTASGQTATQGATSFQALASLLTQVPTPSSALQTTGLASALVTGKGTGLATGLEGGATSATGSTGLGLGFGEAGLATLNPARLTETSGSNASTPYAPTQAPLPAEQVALAIGRLTNGTRSFTMQLNPEHLGSVDVRMDVDSKGKTKVSISADRPETLALLKLDSHHLVKALQDAGVSADQSTLNFSLREQGTNSAQDRRSGGSQTGRGSAGSATDESQDTDAAPVRMSLSRHLYDIHA